MDVYLTRGQLVYGGGVAKQVGSQGPIARGITTGRNNPTAHTVCQEQPMVDYADDGRVHCCAPNQSFLTAFLIYSSSDMAHVRCFIALHTSRQFTCRLVAVQSLQASRLKLCSVSGCAWKCRKHWPAQDVRRGRYSLRQAAINQASQPAAAAADC